MFQGFSFGLDTEDVNRTVISINFKTGKIETKKPERLYKYNLYFDHAKFCHVWKVGHANDSYLAIKNNYTNLHLYPLQFRKSIFWFICVLDKLRKECRISLPNEIKLAIIELCMHSVFLKYELNFY